jgi:hypothetical protein
MMRIPTALVLNTLTLVAEAKQVAWNCSQYSQGFSPFFSFSYFCTSYATEILVGDVALAD